MIKGAMVLRGIWFIRCVAVFQQYAVSSLASSSCFPPTLCSVDNETFRVNLNYTKNPKVPTVTDSDVNIPKLGLHSI